MPQISSFRSRVKPPNMPSPDEANGEFIKDMKKKNNLRDEDKK